MLISFLRGFARSTDFHILIHIPIGSYHININSGVAWSLPPNLLSKITKFSTKYFTFLPIKLDMVIPATFQWYHSGPLSTAVFWTSVTQNI